MVSELAYQDWSVFNAPVEMGLDFMESVALGGLNRFIKIGAW